MLKPRLNSFYLLKVCSVWRPLVNSVEDWPLAVCDGSTANQNDLVEADHIRRHYMGSTMYLQYNENQQFYFMSKQSKDDVLIFKNFDSQKDVAAPCKSDELRRFAMSSLLIRFVSSCATCFFPTSKLSKSVSAAREYRGSGFGIHLSKSRFMNI